MKKFIFLVFFASITYSFHSHSFIDMKNANYSDTWIDLQIPGNGYNLEVVRTYNSRSLHNGIFGFGWCSEYETKLEIASTGDLLLTQCGAGMEVRFSPAGDTTKRINSTIAKILKAYKKKNPSTPKKVLKKLRQEIKNDSTKRELLAKQLKIKGQAKSGSIYYSNNNKSDSIIKKKRYYERRLSNGTKQRFNFQGQLIRLFDTNGNFIKFRYNKRGLIDRVTDNMQKSLFIKYYKNKKVLSIKGPGKQIATYKYTDQNDLRLVKLANKEVYKYKYDNLHNLTDVVFPDKTTTKIKYNKKRDWVISFKDRKNCVEKYDYTLSPEDPENHYWSEIKKTCKGKVVNKSRFEFWYASKPGGNGKFLKKFLSQTNNEKSLVEYHPQFERPIKITKNGFTQTFTYNKFGLVKTKKAGKILSKFSYNMKHKKVSQVQVGKDKTVFKYDPKGNLIRATNTSGQDIAIRYDKRGRIAMIRDQAKRIVRIGYENRFGKPNKIERPGLGALHISYKQNGEVKEATSPKGGPTVAVQIASTFSSLLDIVRPAGLQLGL